MPKPESIACEDVPWNNSPSISTLSMLMLYLALLSNLVSRMMSVDLIDSSIESAENSSVLNLSGVGDIVVSKVMNDSFVLSYIFSFLL